MKRVVGLWVHLMSACVPLFAQVDTTYIYNPDTPYGTLDIRIARSDTRYYYLQEDVTFSFRESAPGVKTNTFKDMTTWNSAPYRQGNLREKNGNKDLFVMNYRFLMPNNYDPSYQPGYPIIIMLHGYGERGNCWDKSCYWSTPSWNPNTNSPPAPTAANHSLLNNDHNLLHGGLKHLNAVKLAGGKLPDDPALHPQSFPGFVLFPQSLNGWHHAARVEDAIKLLRLVIKKYNIDENRVYIHALSNGGGGLYQAIKRAPWLFAAALPMSAVSHSGAVDENVIGEVAKIPLWAFQGAKDQNPTPAKTYQTIRALREAGAVVRYSLYSHLGHGTWNTAYNEPDFFKWILSKRKTNPHVNFGTPVICNTTGAGAKFSFSKGFPAYQWEKDGAILAHETSFEYIAGTPGTVRGRFSRKPDPEEDDWEPWSDPVIVTEIQPDKPAIQPLGSTHLRGPGLASTTSGNTVLLQSAASADLYSWYRDGNPVDFSQTGVDDTLRTATFVGFTDTSNGSVTLRTSYSYCPSPPSDAVYLFFNNSAPKNIALDAGKTEFKGIAMEEGIFFTWNDVLNNESGYEIWRRKEGSADFEFAGRAGKDAISFFDGPLEPLTTYAYKFRAVNNTGASGYLPSDALDQNYLVTTAADRQNPGAPQNLKVILNTIDSFTLSWTAASDNTGIREYIIAYGEHSISTDSMVTTFTIKDLPRGAAFPVSVRAVDHAGNTSPWSNQIIATTYVLGLNYRHSTGGWEDLDDPSMIATWADPEFQGNVKNITLAPRTQEDFFNFRFDGYLDIGSAGYYLFRITSDDGSRMLLDDAVLIDNDGLHGTVSVVSDTIYLTPGPHSVEIQYFEYAGGNNLSLTFKGPDSLSGPFVNIPDSLFRSGKYVPVDPPATPVALSAQEKGMQMIHLAWQSDHPVEIYRSAAHNGDYAIIGKSETAAFTDSAGLEPATTYHYKVRAVTGSGSSPLSGSVQATTAADTVLPTAPEDLEIQSLSHTHVALTWAPSTDNAGVKGYQIFADSVLAGTTEIPAFMISGLVPNTSYVITVVAFDASGNKSQRSGGLQVTTDASAVFYSMATGDLNALETWKQNADGTGGSPVSFAEDGHYFIISNRSQTTLGGPWEVTGTASRVVLPDGVTLTADHSFSGRVVLEGQSTLHLDHADAPDLVEISEGSTVNFNVFSPVPAGKYGNVILSRGSLVKTFGAGTIEIRGNLTVEDGIVLKGAAANATTVVIRGDFNAHGATGPTAADNRINVKFEGAGPHLLSGGEFYFGHLILENNAIVDATGTGHQGRIFTGSLNGGGISIGSGALLDLGAGSLILTDNGVVNAHGETGRMAVAGGSLHLHSKSALPSRVIFDTQNHRLDTLSVDLPASAVSIGSDLDVSGGIIIGDGVLNAGGHITLLSLADQTATIGRIQGSGAINGNLTVQHYLEPLGDSWRELSTPVSGVTIEDWQEFFPITGPFDGASSGAGLSAEPSMFIFSSSGLTPYPPAENSNQAAVEKGRGYYTRIQESSPVTLAVTGNPFQGNVEFALNTSADSESGWNLLGNPYASAIEWTNDSEAWIRSAVGNVIAVKKIALINGETVGQYRYYDPFLGKGRVEPGQAFWVRSTGPAASLIISEKAKAAASGDYPDPGNPASYIRIALQQGDRSDETFIIFHAEATGGYDPAYEGPKLLNEGLFNLSTQVEGGIDLAVNHLPDSFCSEIVKLNLRNTGPGTYTFLFSGTETLADIGAVTLTDHFTGASTPVSADAVSFTVTDAPGSTGSGRFTLTFERNILDTDSPEVSGSDICGGDAANVIITGSQEGAGYAAVNAAGAYLSDVVEGGPDEIVIPLYDSMLTAGTNLVRILAGYNGCSKQFLSSEIRLDYTPAFEISVEEELSVCAGSPATIRASGIPDGGHYKWMDDEMNVIAGEEGATMVTPAIVRETVYHVAGVLPNGCESGLKAVHIFADSLEMPVITLVGDTLFTQVEATFQWRKDGENIEGATYAYYVPGTTGSYSVIAFNGGCALESASVSYKVCAIDPSGPAVSAGNGCGSQPVYLIIANSQADIEYAAVNRNDEVISNTEKGNGQSIQLQLVQAALDSGLNAIRVLASDEGCESRLLDDSVSFEYIPPFSPNIIQLDEVLMTDSTGNVQWKKDGEIVAGATKSSFRPDEPGMYSVVVQVGECSMESEPFGFLITSLEETGQFNLEVYPVPASFHNLMIRVQSHDPSDISVRVLDLNGRLVLRRALPAGGLSHGIPLQAGDEPLPDGIYILIATQKTTEVRRKIVIRNP